MNDYNNLAETYQETHIKPDKQYSTLPTVLKMAGEVEGKTVVDLGCGDGFFAKEFAKASPGKVIGIDNSDKQIELAKKDNPEGIDYRLSDIFTDELPKADVVCAPYVLNYADSVESLGNLFNKINTILNPNGVFVGVVDLPTGADLTKLGARKVLSAPEDGADIEINLCNNGQPICTLHANYFKPETITRLLNEAGFKSVSWEKPILDPKGEEAYGKDFWEGYLDNPELGYIKAIK